MSARDQDRLRQDDQQDALGRLGELIRALDGVPDPAPREIARELLALVLDLHSVGLAKLTEIIAKAEGGTAMLARLAEDERVSAMLLLHGLHPDDVETRVRRAIDGLRPHLGVHGLRLDVLEIAKGAVRLQLRGSGAATIKPPLIWTLPGEIEDAVMEAAPEVERILIDGFGLRETDGAASAAE
jgi:Fe-S cluster biogenesis protein NfuA